MQEFKPVVFKVGNEMYGVDITQICGIEKVISIVPIPNTSKHILGIINLRGDVIPVYSLRSKFNMEKRPYDEETKFIIVKVDEMMLALEVDSVEEIQNVSEGMLHEVPVIVKNDDTKYAERILNINGKLVVIVDIYQLLNDEEMRSLTEVVKDL